MLLGSGNTLVEKDTLLRMVWGDVHVDEAVLARAISDLRKALGQTERQEWIETVPKFGYRFAAEVHAPRMEAPGKRARLESRGCGYRPPSWRSSWWRSCWLGAPHGQATVFTGWR